MLEYFLNKKIIIFCESNDFDKYKTKDFYTIIYFYWSTLGTILQK